MSVNLAGQLLKPIENAPDARRAPDARIDKIEKSTKADSERLKALAAQFESLLVGQMMQQMRASLFDSDEGGDKSSAPLADALFAELSLAMSRSGGMGLADAYLPALERQTAEPLTLAGRAAGEGNEGIAIPTPAPIALPSLGGRMSSAYGWRRDPVDSSMKFHRGMDIAMPVGHDVTAPQAGKVAFAGEQPGYGLTVILDHGNQMTTRYAHLSAISAAVGDQVETGQIIAQSGATGRVTGPHLHFEVMEAGKSVNPAEKLATYTAARPQ